MKRLQDKVCIVTGAAQGIGLATAVKFAREGARVIVWDRQESAVKDAVAAGVIDRSTADDLQAALA